MSDTKIDEHNVAAEDPLASEEGNDEVRLLHHSYAPLCRVDTPIRQPRTAAGGIVFV
jgi:hypothetical protein